MSSTETPIRLNIVPAIASTTLASLLTAGLSTIAGPFKTAVVDSIPTLTTQLLSARPSSRSQKDRSDGELDIAIWKYMTDRTYLPARVRVSDVTPGSARIDITLSEELHDCGDREYNGLGTCPEDCPTFTRQSERGVLRIDVKLVLAKASLEAPWTVTPGRSSIVSWREAK